MMEFLWGMMEAYQQVVWLAAGFFLWFLAAIMGISFIHDHRTKTILPAHISALRVKGDMTKGQGMYFPIVTYTTADGMAIMLILFFFGIIPAGIGITQYPLTIYTFVTLAVFAVWMSWKLSHIIRPRREWESREQFRKRKTEQLLQERAALPRIDQSQALLQLRKMDNLIYRFIPLSLLVGLVFIGAGTLLAHNVGGVWKNRHHAEGTIVAWDRTTGSSSYFPVIEFRDAHDKPVRFTDNVGHSTPNTAIGQNVDVVFDINDPTLAMLSAGVPVTFLIVMACWAVGLMILWTTAQNATTIRKRRKHGYTPGKDRA
ncbi:MAG TPA: DUF3592 domain-containing protein [Micavibrio sp.]